MENPKVGQKAEATDIAYLVGRRTITEEVIFPRAKDWRRAHEPPKQAADWTWVGPTIIMPIFYIGSLLWGLWIFSIFAPKGGFGPAPSPEIIPTPPYYVGETIKGPSTKGVIHTWIYEGATSGWIDP